MENNSENNQSDTTIMDKVVQEIYSVCDLDHTNSVSVSKLIEYVKPYLTDNLSELQDLRKKLDPNDTNPNVTQETFHAALNEWSNTIKQTTTTKEGSDKDLSFIQSTPRQSLERNHHQIFHTSNISEIETIDDNNSNTEIDRIVDLEQQLTRITRELQLTKQQLIAAEEHNESLTIDLDRRLQQIQESSQLIKRLNDNKFENDELIDEIDSLKRKIRNLEKQLDESNKEQCQYVDKIQTLENKKLYLQNKWNLSQKQKKELEQQMVEMSDMITTKEVEISVLKGTTEKLQLELHDKNDLIEFHKNEIEILKHKIMNLEDVLEQRTIQNESIHNLMEQLNNPVTPIINTPNALQNSCRNSTPNINDVTNIDDDDDDVNISPILSDIELPPGFLTDNLCQASNYMNIYEDNIKADLSKKQELIERLKNQNKEYIDKVELYKNDFLILKNSYDELTKSHNELVEKNQNLVEQIRDYKNSNFNKKQIKIDRLEESIDELKQDLSLAKNDNKKLLNTINMKDETIKQLSNELESQRIDFDKIINQTVQHLDGIILVIRDLNFNDEMEMIVTSSNSNLDNLQNKSKLISELVEIFINKYQQLLNNYEAINKTEIEIPNQLVFPSQSNDEFLENLQLDHNIEEQFKRLELKFQINFQTTQERFNKQKQRSNKLIDRFYRNVDNCLNLLKTTNHQINLNIILINLEQIKDDYLEMITTIQYCGNLEYEFRIMKCWNLIGNYIGKLQSENCKHTEEDNKLIEFRQLVRKSNDDYKESKFTRMCKFSLTFLLFLLFLYLLLIVYVHMKCDNKTKICPLDSFFSNFIKYNPSKTY